MPPSSSRPQSAASLAATLPTATIVRRRDCTDDLFLLWLEPSIEFPFTPGQYVTIGAAGIERPYSIASAPHEPAIELFIEYPTPGIRRQADACALRSAGRGQAHDATQG